MRTARNEGMGWEVRPAPGWPREGRREGCGRVPTEPQLSWLSSLPLALSVLKGWMCFSAGLGILAQGSVFTPQSSEPLLTVVHPPSLPTLTWKAEKGTARHDSALFASAGLLPRRRTDQPWAAAQQCLILLELPRQICGGRKQTICAFCDNQG